MSQTSGSTQLLLKHHEYVLYQVIHPAPLFPLQIISQQKNTEGRQKKIGGNKNVTKQKRDRAVVFMSTQVLLWH